MAAPHVPWLRVASFVVLTFALLWLPELVEDHGALGLFRIYSPALAGLAVRLFAREGFADAGLRVRGVAPRHWALAVALPVSWSVLDGALDVSLGFSRFHPEAFGGLGWKLARLFPGWAFFLLGEELGWRSYLVPKLRALPAPASAALVGLVWWAWHPHVWSGSQATVGFGIVFLAYAFLLSLVFGWLYLASGSVWPCLVLHVVHNLAPFGLVTPVAGPLPDHVTDLVPPLITAVVLWRSGALRRRLV